MKLLAVLILALSAAAEGETLALTVTDPYFRESIPGQNRTAGFFQMANKGHNDCSLLAASSPQASRLEIHQHSHENGVMRMRQVESLPIAGGEVVTLRPGGYHLMVFDITRPFSAGDKVPVTLDFGSCGNLEVVFDVRSPLSP